MHILFRSRTIPNTSSILAPWTKCKTKHPRAVDDFDVRRPWTYDEERRLRPDHLLCRIQFRMTARKKHTELMNRAWITRGCRSSRTQKHWRRSLLATPVWSRILPIIPAWCPTLLTLKLGKQKLAWSSTPMRRPWSRCLCKSLSIVVY